MPVSVFDLFKIGVGPSSSHTVGPMRIALRFVRELESRRQLAAVAGLEVRLYGSLALTGRGHATDRAVLLGLMGHDPETVELDHCADWIAQVRSARLISLLGRHPVPFDEPRHLVFQGQESL
jgi:L-serine dehydratase